MWTRRDTREYRREVRRAKQHKKKQHRLLLSWTGQHRITYIKPARNRWLGLRSLIPVVFASDEHDRHLLGLGWGLTGYLMVAYKQCSSFGDMSRCPWWGKTYSYGRWRNGGKFHNEWEGVLLDAYHTEHKEEGRR